MLTALGQRLEDISDDRLAGILLRLFFGAVIVSLVAWGVGVIEFRRPFLEWVSSLFEWVDSFAQNTGSEMLGAFLTFILLEVIRGSRERKVQEKVEERRTEDLKALQCSVGEELKDLQRTVGEQLQEQMRSFVQAQELARLRAAKTPEERQPILDSMKATGLLQEANLERANLRGVSLGFASLEGANLAEAKLQGTILLEANLQGADLRDANLRGARWLTVVQLRQAESLEGAVLPDGTSLPGRTLDEFINNVPEAPWHEVFRAWCETVETDEFSWIKPANLSDADDDE